jgi:hypothetical protein
VRKLVGPARLTLIRNGSAEIDIRIRVGPGNEWRGVAAFPVEMMDDAAGWIDLIETPNDLEDLVREFGSSEAWGSYQEFRNMNGF